MIERGLSDEERDEGGGEGEDAAAYNFLGQLWKTVVKMIGGGNLLKRIYICLPNHPPKRER